MKKIKRIAAAMLALSMLTGCSFLSGGDDLLQTPQPSKNNLLLQKKLNSLNKMTEISPQSGQYRNTVTFEDLDGDNIDEAIATMREGSSGQIAVYVFRMDGEDYTQIGCIKGQGTAISELSFPVFSKDGSRKGMVITWTLSNSVEHGMTVCGLSKGKMFSLAELEYTDYTVCDLDEDGLDEILAINYSQAGRKTAQLYNYKNGSVSQQSQADATQDVQTIANITTGRLAGGEKAVFVDNKFEKDNGMQTDVYALKNGELQNLALSSDISTYRPLSMYYSEDVNADGLVEVPQLMAMPGYERVAQTDTVWMIDWYDFKMGTKSPQKRAFTTYHSLNDEWLFMMPKSWRRRVTVKAYSDEDGNKTVFSDFKTGDVLAEVCVFTNSDDIRNFRRRGYNMLRTSPSKCYAVRIGKNGSGLKITADKFKQRFSIIQTQWY